MKLANAYCKKQHLQLWKLSLKGFDNLHTSD